MEESTQDTKDNQSVIPYNKPHFTGNELSHLSQAIDSQYLAGNGSYTAKCHSKFNELFGFKNCFLTHSCSLALEMAATICDLQIGDEVIVPSFAYVTTASSFQRNGAKLIFADSEENTPHISPLSILSKITSKTKVLVIVHYAGSTCNMVEIMKIVKQHDLILIEDCAHAINAHSENRFLGTLGQMSTFSFHETKNIHCGEGGLLVINEEKLIDQAQQVWHEGTNRVDFEKGFKNKYEWVCQGSSYQPSELSTSFLFAQLMEINEIQKRRKEQWDFYYSNLKSLSDQNSISLPEGVHEGHNAHIFYFKCNSNRERELLISHLKENGIMAIFHYLPLHKSPFWLLSHKAIDLENAENWSNLILRLPLYYDLSENDQKRIIKEINTFYAKVNH